MDDTTDIRAELARQLEGEIGPLIEKDKYHGGYNCCGCSAYGEILDHAIRIVSGEQS